MDEVFENIHSCNSKEFEDFFRLKMETREETHNDNKKKMKRT